LVEEIHVGRSRARTGEKLKIWAKMKNFWSDEFKVERVNNTKVTFVGTSPEDLGNPTSHHQTLNPKAHHQSLINVTIKKFRDSYAASVWKLF
jgi:hypothetical protein